MEPKMIDIDKNLQSGGRSDWPIYQVPNSDDTYVYAFTIDQLNRREMAAALKTSNQLSNTQLHPYIVFSDRPGYRTKVILVWEHEHTAIAGREQFVENYITNKLME